MKSILRSRGLLLAAGSGLASIFNFYSFVIYPSIFGTNMLEIFTRDNYLGGLYLFGIGSSIAPFSIFVFIKGRGLCLKLYVQLSVASLIIICLAGFWLVRFPWSYLCLMGAICMHCAGFFLASLICDEKILIASVLQTFQPMLFALMISLGSLWTGFSLNWAIDYLLSTLICLIMFMSASNIPRLRYILSEPPSETLSLFGVVSRVLVCVSFPLFFQFEQIICGKFTNVNLGGYIMLQKLYSSISISLFGSLSVLLLANKIHDKENNFINLKVIVMALASAAMVLVVGSVLVYGNKSSLLDYRLVVGCAFVAFFFTLCSFIGMMLATMNPFLGLKIIVFSFLIYLTIIYFWPPATMGQFLVFAGCFFIVYFLTGLFVRSYACHSKDICQPYSP